MGSRDLPNYQEVPPWVIGEELKKNFFQSVWLFSS
jgi:hypothetical protein